MILESYDEIQANLTEMESCMKLLFPDFELTNVKAEVPRSSSSNCQPANIIEEQPCCSKDLINGPKEAALVRKQTSNEDHGNKEKEQQNSDSTNQKKDEDEDESGEEEQPSNADLFIRNSGLLSHSYSLDLNLIAGKYPLQKYYL